jgi:hypothetical protein
VYVYINLIQAKILTNIYKRIFTRLSLIRFGFQSLQPNALGRLAGTTNQHPWQDHGHRYSGHTCGTHNQRLRRIIRVAHLPTSVVDDASILGRIFGELKYLNVVAKLYFGRVPVPVQLARRVPSVQVPTVHRWWHCSREGEKKNKQINKLIKRYTLFNP